MKNKFFYLLGTTAMLAFSTGTFTSCQNGVDDEYLELQNQGNCNSSQGEEEEGATQPEINGDYFAGGENELTLTYNGEELTGRKVTVSADEMNETAVITMTGTELDLTSLLGGLMEFKYTANSPVPGVKELTFTDVDLYRNKNNAFVFKVEDAKPTYILTCDGVIENGKMDLKITHELVGENPLASTWNLAPAKETGNSPAYAPLWFSCDSDVKISLGSINVGAFELPINQPIQGIVSLLTSSISSMIMNGILGQNITVEKLIGNMLKDVTAETTGGLYGSYNWAKTPEGSIDFNNPQWSDEMSHNIIRYYYDAETPGKFYIEPDAHFLMSALGGLIPSIASANVSMASRANKDPEVTKQIGRELIEMLIPLLRDGIPCEYTFENVENGDLAINIEGETLRLLLLKVLELANDEYAKDFVNSFIDSSLGDYAGNIKLLLQNAPAGLTYKSGDSPENYQGVCGPTKLGLKFTR